MKTKRFPIQRIRQLKYQASLKRLPEYMRGDVVRMNNQIAKTLSGSNPFLALLNG
jgi:hypothetical protein